MLDDPQSAGRDLEPALHGRVGSHLQADLYATFDPNGNAAVEAETVNRTSHECSPD
ncbi:hypothetical protein KM868_10860 [Micrococcus luteus]|uniref:hypothetical protein n=1 Tax=Micrococcus TaxID=1269 RepID=UPI0013037443|nr:MULTISPECIES: hypothetical protein [Micrococcus]MBF0745623.1 hypothetical protein [Micrococcus yunnanensis]MBU8763996.1 hypothetical protein [Micrococcus luteus]